MGKTEDCMQWNVESSVGFVFVFKLLCLENDQHMIVDVETSQRWIIFFYSFYWIYYIRPPYNEVDAEGETICTSPTDFTKLTIHVVVPDL